MMSSVKIVFFASLKDVIGQDSCVMALELPLSIAQLKQILSNELTNGQALLAANIQSSVDFEFTRDADIIPESAREIAFFPPVTGG